MSSAAALPRTDRTTPARLRTGMPPVLSIVVDCEEGFDWRSPLRGTPHTLDAIAGLPRVAELVRRLEARFACLVTYPVLRDDGAWRHVAALADAGCAVLGAHLHAWVTPPFDEASTLANSYQGNLHPAHEEAKVATLVDAFRARTGQGPTVFKAGRSGFGRASPAILAAQGFQVDVSYMPGFSYARHGGPSFLEATPDPFFFQTPSGALLELPDTGGFLGAARALGPRLHPLATTPTMLSLHVPGVLARLGLLERMALTPEGITQAEARRLTRRLHADGHRVFQLSFHSSSLMAGGNAYVPDAAAVDALLTWLGDYITFFRTTLGGEVATPDEVLTRLEPG